MVRIVYDVQGLKKMEGLLRTYLFQSGPSHRMTSLKRGIILMIAQILLFKVK